MMQMIHWRALTSYIASGWSPILLLCGLWPTDSNNKHAFSVLKVLQAPVHLQAPE